MAVDGQLEVASPLQKRPRGADQPSSISGAFGQRGAVTSRPVDRRTPLAMLRDRARFETRAQVPSKLSCAPTDRLPQVLGAEPRRMFFEEFCDAVDGRLALRPARSTGPVTSLGDGLFACGLLLPRRPAKVYAFNLVDIGGAKRDEDFVSELRRERLDL